MTTLVENITGAEQVLITEILYTLDKSIAKRGSHEEGIRNLHFDLSEIGYKHINIGVSISWSSSDNEIIQIQNNELKYFVAFAKVPKNNNYNNNNRNNNNNNDNKNNTNINNNNKNNNINNNNDVNNNNDNINNKEEPLPPLPLLPPGIDKYSTLFTYII